MQQFIIEENQAGQRLDKFLHKYLPNAGSSFLYKMLRKKNITLNGKKAEGKEILQLHDEIKCFFSDETFAKFAGVNVRTLENTASKQIDVTEYVNAYMLLSGVKIANAPDKPQENTKNRSFCAAYNEKITVLYEDKHVLILNKPAGILTQKAKVSDISLNEWMIGYLLQTGKITAEELALFKPSVCNRLDRNTSGIVLCGISLKGSQVLSELIRDRSVKKYYRTICKGILTDIALLEGSLEKDSKTNTVTVSVEGSQIKTAYEPIQKLQKDLTYLEVELITGKTHQIRAHLASIGHPLAGDVKYGNKALNQQFMKHYQLKYQLLHAYRLEFPVLEGELSTLSEKSITAPLPERFKAILEDLS